MLKNIREIVHKDHHQTIHELADTTGTLERKCATKKPEL
jgi:hypothetical protein